MIEIILLIIVVVCLFGIIGKRSHPAHMKGFGAIFAERCPSCRTPISHRANHCPHCTQPTGFNQSARPMMSQRLWQTQQRRQMIDVTPRRNKIARESTMIRLLAGIFLVAASTVAHAQAPAPPAPLGWLYAPYTSCADPPRCSMGMVTVDADGLNVRQYPSGPASLALVNGTFVVALRREGEWLLVLPGCDLVLTGLWSWTSEVPLARCWIY